MSAVQASRDTVSCQCGCLHNPCKLPYCRQFSWPLRLTINVRSEINLLALLLKHMNKLDRGTSQHPKHFQCDAGHNLPLQFHPTVSDAKAPAGAWQTRSTSGCLVAAAVLHYYRMMDGNGTWNPQPSQPGGPFAVAHLGSHQGWQVSVLGHLLDLCNNTSEYRVRKETGWCSCGSSGGILAGSLIYGVKILAKVWRCQKRPCDIRQKQTRASHRDLENPSTDITSNKYCQNLWWHSDYNGNYKDPYCGFTIR